MLKMTPSFVLGSSKACDVAPGYASAWTPPAASLDRHFEHPTKSPVSRANGNLTVAMTWLLIVFSPGCAQSAHQTGQYVFDKEVPKEVRRQVDWNVSFPDLKAAPSAYEGRTVVLGGIILGAKRAKNRTEIEVMQLPLERGFTPSGDRHSSQGRFLAVQTDGLDPATLREGTPVTVVGQVAGAVTKPLDESDYTYPVVEIRKVVDWVKAETPRYYGYAPYPYAPYYGYYPYRFWGYSPYWSPYGPYAYPYYFGPSRGPSTPAVPPPSAIPPQFKKDD